MDSIMETERLILRKMETSDYRDLCKILQDEAVMYAYEGAFSDEEARNWLNRQLRRYEEDGFGLWAVILKENGELIGQCGLTIQDIPDRQVVEIGYLFRRKYWHRGYATEAAKACREYAFHVLNVEEVFSIIRDTNTASVKRYRGVDMPHDVFVARRAKEA